MQDPIAKISSHFTAIGRPIYVTYRPNLLMLVAVGLIGLFFFGTEYSQTNDVSIAVSRSTTAVIAATVSWAVAREQDPEHDYSAFIGMIPAALLITNDLDLWVIGSILLLVRMVSRVVGPPAYLTDSIAIVLVVGLAIFLSPSWLIGVLGVLGFALDAWLRPALPRQYIFAGIVALLTIISIITNGAESINLPDIAYLSAIILLTIGYFVFLWQTPNINIRSDYGEHYPVQQHRLKISMLFGASSAVIISLWGGNIAIQELLPIWTALAGVVVYWLLMRVIRN